MLANFRDLGGIPTANGKTIKLGKLFRCQQLADGTEDDRAHLADLGIGLVMDLRSKPERTERPDGEVAGAQNMHLPIFDDVRLGITRGEEGTKSIARSLESGSLTVADVDAHMQQMYTGFVNDEFARGQYSRFIDAVLETGQRGQGTLWHCTAGKDRAGFATVIVLEILGVERTYIMQDYLRSNEELEDTVEALLNMLHAKLPANASRDSLRQYFRVDESYLDAAYKAADETFGSFDAFLEDGLAVDAAKRALFHETFLA